MIDWRSAKDYSALFLADRRCFAWEWLRRSPSYHAAWLARDRPDAAGPERFGMLGWVDPDLATPRGRPIWNDAIDPKVLEGRVATKNAPDAGLFDIRDFARFVSVEIDETHVEHWLLSDGHWTVRLDLHNGTLLGGPVLLEHRFTGMRSAAPKIGALQQLLALSSRGALPASMQPRERRAARWILELRVCDALMDGATQQEMARAFFGGSVARKGWRIESASYRLRVQRLVRAARRYLAAPLSGPWFK